MPSLPWSGFGLGGIVAAIIGMILTGRLIPWPTWRAWQRERDERLADARAENAKLHSAVDKLGEAMDLYNIQLQQLLSAVNNNSAFLASLHGEGVKTRGGLVEVVETEKGPA